MIIDFHTHIFPDEIAKSTIEHLTHLEDGVIAYTDGTYDGLKKSMKEAGVDVSVILPVVTRPGQFDTVNSYAAKINEQGGIISFGGIHPDNDYEECILRIKELGLKGIKLHPDYQNAFIDDERYIRIIAKAVKEGLIVSIHGGMDIGLPDPIHCTPKRVITMLERVEELNKDMTPDAIKIIIAHMGGYSCWDDTEEYLVGKNIYLDCGYTLGLMDDSQFKRIVDNHGADRILFATDSPWQDQKENVSYLSNMGFSEDELNMMFSDNAKELLGSNNVISAINNSD